MTLSSFFPKIHNLVPRATFHFKRGKQKNCSRNKVVTLIQKQPVFYKKAILKDFAEFTEKKQYQKKSLFKKRL